MESDFLSGKSAQELSKIMWYNIFIFIIQIKSNEIELVVEKRSKNLEDILKTNNVTGDIRIPQNMECNVF